MNCCCTSSWVQFFLIRWWSNDISWIIVGITFGDRYDFLLWTLLLLNQLKSAGKIEILLLLVMSVLVFTHSIADVYSYLLLITQLPVPEQMLLLYLILLSQPWHKINLLVLTSFSSAWESSGWKKGYWILMPLFWLFFRRWFCCLACIL